MIYCISFIVTGEGLPACFENGECTESLLLKYQHEIYSKEGCLDMCQQTSECEYFTYYEDDSSCLAFANCVTFSTDTCSDCYSGYKSCEGRSKSCSIYMPVVVHYQFIHCSI